MTNIEIDEETQWLIEGCRVHSAARLTKAKRFDDMHMVMATSDAAIVKSALSTTFGMLKDQTEQPNVSERELPMVGGSGAGGIIARLWHGFTGLVRKKVRS